MRTLGRAAAVALGAGFVYAAFIYLTLPDVRALRTTNPKTTAFMQLRVREARAKSVEPKQIQRWVPYSRISPQLKRAVLVAEDSGFWRHEGIEFEQMKESMEANIERLEFFRGGSTITQQLAKNLYLSPSKNPVRKVRELLIARRLEAELPKQRILELYLNLIEWGDGIWGAEAAARTYFGKSAADLGAHESALLAAAIVNPRLLSPAHPTARLRRRQQMIMRRMGAVTPPPLVAETPVVKPLPDGEQAPSQPAGAVPAGGPPVALPGEQVPPAEPVPPPCEHPPCAVK
jgi:monofunctional glycosyltransferase